MKFLKKSAILLLSLTIATSALFAKETLKSTEEEYYDFLSLTGNVIRPTLGYRTLSDSEWSFVESTETVTNEDGTTSKKTTTTFDSSMNVWKNNNLGNKYLISGNENLKWKIYGPSWYNSYNTAAPYGQNDGALWQGVGYNTSFTFGARFEAYGLELTVKPVVCFSQNAEFEYITPNYSGTTYAGKADTYGYYGVQYIDAPQRFGNEPFFTFDWGDTEIRYTWNTLTAGFGTQAIWLGPAQLNPIISSNNATSYPKVDIGLRKTSLYMPWFGWYLGDVEFRGWWGYLSESEYFDNDDSNDHNLITGFSAAWAPPYLTGLTLGINRTMLSKWNNMSSYTLFGIYDAFNLTSGGGDSSDQRISFTADWTCTKAGLDLYVEWARNDFSPNLDYLIRYPFHTQGWTLGLRKASTFTKKIRGCLNFEITNLECSSDYDRLIGWYTTFYSHGIITQGYTNGGQWLGAGIGTGGNSQYLGYTLYFPKGSANIFVQRRNPDLDYTMYIDSRKYSENYSNGIWSAEGNIRTIVDFGIGGTYWLFPSLQVGSTIVFEDEHNPLNVSTTEGNGASSIHRYNFAIELSVKYNF
ncbi:MAG: capsule assembly Wzi family protein [Treponema sp.]